MQDEVEQSAGDGNELIEQAEHTEYEPIDHEKPELSNHIRCVAHTLSLIATTDTIKAIEKSPHLKRTHQRVMSRLNALWAVLGRPKQRELLAQILEKCLKRPAAPRWNSFFDALEQIVSLKEKIIKAITELELESLKEVDFDYINEYIKCMRPVAVVLDMLQAENNTYYGALLPTLLILRNQLCALLDEDMVHCKSIVNALIHNLDSRYEYLFNIEGEGRNAAIAAVTHPFFKGRWTSLLSTELQEKVKKLVIDSAIKQQQSVDCVEELNTDKNISETSFFNFGNGTNCFASFSQDHSQFSSTAAEVEVLQYLGQPCTADFNVLNNFPVIKKMFLLYNTPLPSSASVERLFNYAMMFNLARFNRLCDDLFEKRTIMKANKMMI